MPNLHLLLKRKKVKRKTKKRTKHIIKEKERIDLAININQETKPIPITPIANHQAHFFLFKRKEPEQRNKIEGRRRIIQNQKVNSGIKKPKNTKPPIVTTAAKRKSNAIIAMTHNPPTTIIHQAAIFVFIGRGGFCIVCSIN